MMRHKADLDGNHAVIPTDRGKLLTEFSSPHDKSPAENGIEETLSTITKAVHDKPIDIIPSWKPLSYFLCTLD